MLKIDLLLATYNGEKYLDAHLESLVNQTNYDWQIIARDDGSSDSTPKILTVMGEKYPDRMTVIDDGEKHLGVIGNFSRLLDLSSGEYTMFSDQDDIWVLNKIETSIKRMEKLEKIYGKETPILIHSDLRVVDENLKTKADSFWRYQSLDPNLTSMNKLLIQNNITGCTMLINKALRDKARPIPYGAMMHDWWIALVAAGFGIIDHIPQATILYRQHEGNMLGAKEWKPLHKLLMILKTPGRFVEIMHTDKATLLRSQKQARLFLQRYDSVIEKNMKIMIETYSNLSNMNFYLRKYYFLKHRYFQSGFFWNIVHFFWI